MDSAIHPLNNWGLLFFVCLFLLWLFCFFCMCFFVVWQQISMVCLTNRLHIAVRLFSNRSQMKSKFGKDKKSGTRPTGDRITDALIAFLTSSVIYY